MDTNTNPFSDIENSFEGMKRPEADPYLYSKIIARLKAETELFLKPKFVWLSAASFAVLLILNIILFTIRLNSTKASGQDLKQLSNAFHLMNENSINYN